MKPNFEPMTEAGWGWFNRQCPILRVEDTQGLMAWDCETKEFVGGLVLDNFTDNSVQGHFVVTNPLLLRHGFTELCADYIFNKLGKKFLYALVPGDNDKAFRLNTHIGFTEKCRFPEAFAQGVDYVILELSRENCKYLPKQEAA